MKPTLVFATGNPNKLKEVRALIGHKYTIKGLSDIGCTKDIPETSDTIEGNALLKARYVKEHYQLDCFSEDTGLEVDALAGAPGIYSARFAGPQKDADDNMDLLLKKLQDEDNRAAQFRTVVALILNGKEYTFEGIIRGHIAPRRLGDKGFGYDPLFIPEGYATSFAQMEQKNKNVISHRGRAIQKLQDFLDQV